MQPRAVLGEAAEDDVCDGRRGRQRVDHCRHGNPRGAIGGKTVDAGRNGGKGNRCEAVYLAQLQRAAITGSQRIILAFTATVPHRSNGMNHMLRRQTIASGDLGVAGLAATKCAAFGEQPRSGRTMDRAIDPAAAQQRTIRGVDDGINAQ
jgi:hypothetical protein